MSAEEAKSGSDTSTASSSDSSDTSSKQSKGFTRGENQKVVTDNYRDNWDAIFGKKRKR